MNLRNGFKPATFITKHPCPSPQCTHSFIPVPSRCSNHSPDCLQQQSMFHAQGRNAFLLYGHILWAGLVVLRARTDVRAAAAVQLQNGTDINAALAAAERGKQTAKTHQDTCMFLLERWCAPSLHPHGRPYKYALLFAQRRSQSGLLRAHDAITSLERE